MIPIMAKLALILVLPLLVAAGAHAGRSASRSSEEMDVSLRPVRWTLVGGSGPRELKTGRTVPIIVQAEIAKGWHIYSLTQKPGGPIALRLDVIGGPDVVVRGVIDAPKPERKFDRNFGIETELYSGNPRFTIPVGVPARTSGGVRKFQIGARYQVCSDKLCLPPRTDKLDASLRVAGPK